MGQRAVCNGLCGVWSQEAVRGMTVSHRSDSAGTFQKDYRKSPESLSGRTGSKNIYSPTSGLVGQGVTLRC